MADEGGTAGDGGDGGAAAPDAGAAGGDGGAGRTFTQEEVNSFIANERRAIETKFGEEVTTLTAQLDAFKAETETATKTAAQSAEKVAELEAALGQESTKAMRYKVAVEKGLPLTVADRLQGGTEEELTADAEALAALLKKPEGSGGLAGSPMGRGAPPAELSMTDRIRIAAGRGSA